MDWPLSLLFLFVILYAQAKKKHKVNVFLAIFSIVCDTFYFNFFGLNFLLVYFIGYINIPFILKSSIVSGKNFNIPLRGIRAEYLFLIATGVFFGFLFPWQDLTGERAWNQTAQGKTVVQLFRIFSELLVLYYFAILVIKKKISIRSIVYAFAISSTFSFWVGLIDYYLDYQIKSSLFDLVHFESTRFLGLNGEPKALGRVGALSYAIVFLYKQHFKEKGLFLWFSLLTNLLAVILSSSASSLVLFFAINLYVFSGLSFRKIFATALLAILFVVFYTSLSKNDFFVEHTDTKITQALFGTDNFWVPNEPKFFTRFDIWDRLALIYLWQNPKYLATGVGPNLISIPMSANIPEHSFFYEGGRADSVPNILPNNILARSGFIGITLFAWTIFSIYFRLRKSLPPFFKKVFVAFIIFNIVYFNVTFYLIIGVVMGYYYLSNIEENQKANPINSLSRI